MFFRDVYGHDELKQQLIDAVKSGRIPHAQLFCGPEGVGKLPLALAYAQYVSCENKGENDSCGQCPSCKKYAMLAHPDLHFVFPIIQKKPAGSDEYCMEHLDGWREMFATSPYFNLDKWVEEEFSSVATKQPIIYNCEGNELIRKLQMKACESEYKVVVIWHPELMGAECSNRVLKSIEEPVGKTLFLLVSDKPDDILPTIQSRTQRVVMHALPEKVLADAIRTKNSNADDNQIQYAARLSKGSIIAAFELLDDGANTFLDTFIRLMRKAYVSDLEDLINLSNDLAKLSRKKQISFLQYCQHMIRENFILNVGNTSLNYMTNDENAFSSKFARFINEKNVWQLVEELSKAEFHIERNGMSKIIFYDLALKVMALLKK